ncbi:MAG TPA: dihydrofolate reductase [Alphaproteobacteria bacterium]|nr:dihydrofolate reductase [Alphaproteobacteria bacterium]HOO51847.1 dihydrofolate reductase [Alphaproteobacteria bacterium]
MISLIVAMAENRTIGKGNDLPWHIPEDLKFFKTTTTGKPVIMGRKTFDSILSRIGKPLPGRPHYIISRSAVTYEGVTGCSSLEEAIEKVRAEHPNAETIIMGGASIYEQAIPLIDRMYLTIIHGDVDGDAHFPEVNPENWKLTDKRESSDENWSYEFLTLDRKQ